MKELLDLLINHVVDLLRELLSLVGKGRDTLDNLARDDLVVVLNGLLKLRDGRDLVRLGLGVGLVAASLDDGRVVAAATTVPGEEVGGVTGHVGEGTDGGNLEEVGLHLLGGDLSERVLRVAGRLEREVVGEKAANVGRGHGSARDGVGGILAADPGGENAETGSEDVSALAIVGEVGTAVVDGGGTDGDGLGSSSRRVVASIGVIVASSDGEVNADGDSSVDGVIKSLGLATTKRHVGNGALEALALAILGSLDVLDVGLGSPLNTGNDVSHGTRAVRAEDLDGVNVSLLGNTVLLASDSARAVSAVAIAVDVGIAVRDGLAPLGTTLEVNVLGVGTGVDNVGINTLATLSGIEVLVEGSKAQRITVRDTSQAPGSGLLDIAIALALGINIFGDAHGVDNAITLDVLDLFEDASGMVSQSR